MVSSIVSLPVKWEKYLRQLADDHQVDLDGVIRELCEWAFSNSESKKQFNAWLDDAFPPQGEAEDKARAIGDRERARERKNWKKAPKKKSMRPETTVKTEKCVPELIAARTIFCYTSHT